MKAERPRITHEMILEAAKIIAQKIDGDPETIADHYRYPMDGYQLARELDHYCNWDFNFDDVQELDGMSSTVRQFYDKAEKEWAKENDIQPPFPIGTRITKGVIEGVDKYSPGRYLVKEYGCTQEGRWLLVNFEDAITATEGSMIEKSGTGLSTEEPK